jgi:trimeric autotransporter adhesin
MMPIPTRVALCAVIAGLMVGCGGGSGGGPPPPPQTYSVGGTVSGLDEGTEVVLRIGADLVSVQTDGRFEFPAPIESGAVYRVGVQSAPEDRHCVVLNGRGVVASANVENVQVDCSNIVRWVTDGGVYDTALSSDGRTLYVGGGFSYVGPPTGSFAKLSPETGRPSYEFPKFDGQILAAIPDGAGGWYVAGSFSFVNSKPAQRLVHVLDDNEIDESFDAQPNGDVLALALVGERLLVGGTFSVIGGSSRQNVAAIDATTGRAVAWKADADGAVRVLAASDGALYMGGDFLTVGGESRNGLAAADNSHGSVLAWNPAPQSTESARVEALLVSGDLVYVGGEFKTMGGAARGNVAAVGATSGTATSWAPSARVTVYAMAQIDQALYLAGPGCDGGPGAMAADVATGSTLNWCPQLLYSIPDEQGYNVPARAITTQAGRVFLGGEFNGITVGRQLVTRLGLAGFDAVTGEFVGWSGAGVSGTVNVLATDGTNIVAGGLIGLVDGSIRNGLASFDTQTGRATSWQPQLRSGISAVSGFTGVYVKDLLIDGNRLFAAGRFDVVDSILHTGLFSVDLTQHAVDGWAPTLGSQATVNAIGKFDDAIYILGDFNSIGIERSEFIVGVSSVSGSALAWDVDPLDLFSQFPYESTLEVSDRRVFIGKVGDERTQPTGLLALDRVTGEVVDLNLGLLRADGGVGNVYALRKEGNVLYIGGEFASASGTAHTNLLALDLTSETVLADWLPLPADSAPTGSIAVRGNALYFGTEFNELNLSPTVGSIAVDTGQLLGWSLSVPGPVSALSVDDESVYVGGIFQSILGQLQTNIAKVPR